jgi:hypothetical protein
VQQKYLYVIGGSALGPLKLGISADPDKRVSQLQTGHAERLQVFHREPVAAGKARLFERLLHRDLNHHRAIGEWFRLTVEQAIGHIQFTIIQYDDIDNLAEEMRLHRV